MSLLDGSDDRCGVCGRPSGERDPDEYRHQAEVLRALANAARLQMIDRLSTGDCTVSELTELVGLDQSTVSKHLATLRLHGIVEGRRNGNQVFYHLLTPCVLDFFACASRVMEERR
ncbi:MAG: winged helix-turn-helix transcriptional regulator [Deltaproteobacteria bacterium]|nr:winged helix-turn-helix transcriptional regulator [Deltaproteobacteria bacterium]